MQRQARSNKCVDTRLKVSIYVLSLGPFNQEIVDIQAMESLVGIWHWTEIDGPPATRKKHAGFKDFLMSGLDQGEPPGPAHWDDGELWVDLSLGVYLLAINLCYAQQAGRQRI